MERWKGAISNTKPTPHTSLGSVCQECREHQLAGMAKHGGYPSSGISCSPILANKIVRSQRYDNY